MAEGKKIQARLDVSDIYIGPKADNVILQLGCTAHGDDLITRLTQKREIVSSFFAPNRQVENQVLGRAMDFKRALIRLSWVLPARHREVAEIQNSSFWWLH